MEMETSDMTTMASGIQGRIEKRRYVMDFGPNGALKDVALKVIEDWITNGCRYTGAILIKPSDETITTNDQRFVTALEIEVKAYTVSQGPMNESTPLNLRSAPKKREERLVLSDELRSGVSETVEKALAYTLGENGRDVVLSRLKIDYGFGFSEVTDFPGRFVELLTEILQGGSRYVEEWIVRELMNKYPYIEETKTFKDAVVKLVALDSALPR